MIQIIMPLMFVGASLQASAQTAAPVQATKPAAPAAAPAPAAAVAPAKPQMGTQNIAQETAKAMQEAAMAKGFREGKWEMKIDVTMSGSQQMQAPVPPTMTQYHCMKHGQFNPKEAHLIMIDKSCKVKEVKYSGQTINWKMNCLLNGMPAEGSGTMTNLETTTGGTTEMWMNLPYGMTMKVLTKMSGKWVAPSC